MRPRLPPLVWLALIIGVGTALCGLGGDFVLDDRVAIERSTCVQGPLDLELVFNTNFWCEAGEFRSIETWRPFTVLSWWIVRHLGAGTLPFKGLNALLHGVCIASIYVLGRHLGMSERAAGLGTLLFASLAIHVDAVAPGVAASDLWSACFVLLGVRMLAQGRFSCIPLGMLAVLSKETGVLVLAWGTAAIVFGPREEALARWRRSAVLLGLLGACVFAMLAWRAHVLGAWGATHVPVFVNPLVDADFATRARAALAIIGHYHRLTIVGAPLSADYAHAAIGIGEDIAWGNVLLGIGSVALWAFLGWRFRANAGLRILVVWLLGTCLFVSNALIIMPAMFAERLFYLPTVPLALLAGFGIAQALERGARPRVVLGALAIFISLQTALSIAHTLRYRDEGTIIRHTVESTPGNARARMWWVQHLLREGQWEAAIPHIEVAQSLAPDRGSPWAAAAVVEHLSGRPEAALPLFARAMQLEARDPEVADLFIQFLLRYGHVEAARAAYEMHGRARGQPDPLVTTPP